MPSIYLLLHLKDQYTLIEQSVNYAHCKMALDFSWSGVTRPLDAWIENYAIMDLEHNIETESSRTILKLCILLIKGLRVYTCTYVVTILYWRVSFTGVITFLLKSLRYLLYNYIINALNYNYYALAAAAK